MNLHEYQSKELFELYNLPVSKRGLITKLSDIDEALEKIDFSNGCCLLYTSDAADDC